MANLGAGGATSSGGSTIRGSSSQLNLLPWSRCATQGGSSSSSAPGSATIVTNEFPKYSVNFSRTVAKELLPLKHASQKIRDIIITCLRNSCPADNLLSALFEFAERDPSGHKVILGILKSDDGWMIRLQDVLRR